MSQVKMQKEQCIDAFAGRGHSPLYVPDLTLWYAWHRGRRTLPAVWQGATLLDIARELGVPAWIAARPWRIEWSGVEVSRTEGDDERIARYHTVAGDLSARWTRGPDGDWWQVEHLIKGMDDLPAAQAVIEGRSYVLDPEPWEALSTQVGDDGIVAMELPRRPYSDLLHDFLGWSDGLMLLMGDGREALLGMLDMLESKLRDLVSMVAALPGEVILAPDNLDGQYVSPRVFKNHLAESYRSTADTLHARRKTLIVHIGGPFRHLLAPLAAAGVDAVEGIAGPPQGDATLDESRELAGPALTLWGGIPQDYLLHTLEVEKFEASVIQAGQRALDDPRLVVGIADKVPVDADLGRLKAIAELLRAGGLGARDG